MSSPGSWCGWRCGRRCTDYEGDELFAPEVIERLARALTPEDVQLFYQTAITGKRDLPLAPDPRTGFEMTLLRMVAFRPADESAAPGSARGRRAARRRAARGRHGCHRATAAAAAAPGKLPPPGPGPMRARGRRQHPAPGLRSWAHSSSRAPPDSSRATACSSPARGPSCASRSIRTTSSCALPAQEEKLAQALSRHFGEPVRLEFHCERRRRDAGAARPARLRSRSSPSRGTPSRQIRACRDCGSVSARRCCRTRCGR